MFRLGPSFFGMAAILPYSAMPCNDVIIFFHCLKEANQSERMADDLPADLVVLYQVKTLVIRRLIV